VTCRRDAEKELWFFINVADEARTISELPAGGVDLVSGQPPAIPLSLPPNGVAVIQKGV
jgi:hypothetical protein